MSINKVPVGIHVVADCIIVVMCVTVVIKADIIKDLF